MPVYIILAKEILISLSDGESIMVYYHSQMCVGLVSDALNTIVNESVLTKAI